MFISFSCQKKTPTQTHNQLFLKLAWAFYFSFFLKKIFKNLFWLTSLRRIFKKFSGIEVSGPSQSLSSCSLVKWIGAWEPHVPWQAHIGWTRIKLLSLFGLQTIQNLLTLKKMNRLKAQERKGIILVYGCFSLERISSTDDNTLQLKGLFDTGVDWVIFPCSTVILTV